LGEIETGTMEQVRQNINRSDVDDDDMMMMMMMINLFCHDVKQVLTPSE